jgi:hypothetical protein
MFNAARFLGRRFLHYFENTLEGLTNVGSHLFQGLSLGHAAGKTWYLGPVAAFFSFMDNDL